MNDERRSAIVSLLETRDEHLPVPVRRAETASGFTNEVRPRSCPDCLANGRVMFGCETCGGSGVVQGAALERIAVTDELPDDGQKRDSYAVNDTPTFGYAETRDRAAELDRQIEVLRQQTRPAPTEAELLDEANRRGYVWEEQRRAMYRRFDYGPLDQALDALGLADNDAYRALHAVYVYAWMESTSPWVEQLIERGLAFLGERLPDPLRAPGAPEHPAAERQRSRREAA